MLNHVRQLAGDRFRSAADPDAEEEPHGSGAPGPSGSPGDFAALFSRRAALPLRSFLPERRVWTVVAVAAGSVVLVGSAGYGVSRLYEFVDHQQTPSKAAAARPPAAAAQPPAPAPQGSAPSHSPSPSPSPTPDPSPDPDSQAQAAPAQAAPAQANPQQAAGNFLTFVGTPHTGDTKYTLQNVVVNVSVPVSSLNMQLRVAGGVAPGSRTFSTINSSQGTLSEQKAADGSVVWTWTTKPGVTLQPGKYTVGADYWFSGGSHDFGGDTYTVTATPASGGGTKNLHGAVQ